MTREAEALVHGGLLSWPILLPEKCRALERIEEPEMFEAIYTMAAEFLWRWTGMRFGIGEVTSYPVHRRMASSLNYGSTFYGRGPYGPSQWPWPGAVSKGHVDYRKAFLHNAASIASIRINGEALPEESYYLENSVIYRIDGKMWPTSQDPSFEVTYMSGIPVPPGGQVAAGVLACEFAMAIQNDDHCSLPQRLQSITREGISMTVMDQFEDLEQGRTGIWLIDSWVASVTHAQVGASVTSPNNPRFGGIR